MPPPWTPLAALVFVLTVSALRVRAVRRKHGIAAFNFGRAPAIQGLAERNWKLAVVSALAFAAMAWLTPPLEGLLGRPAWSEHAALRWAATVLFALSAGVIAMAQMQMGSSWRVGVPAEGPGDLVSHGLFGWSRNPIFLGLLGALFALFVWSPHIGTAAVLAGTWTLTLVQVRIEEEALQDKHGDAYRRYAVRVDRWLGRRREPAATG